MEKKKQEKEWQYTKFMIIAGVVLVFAFFYLFHFTIYKTQYYTNVVQYQGINYTINQIWQEPDFCAYGINYSNGTLLWGQGWQPTRPSLPFISNVIQNTYRWNLENKSLAIYEQEWTTKNGIAWACCEATCV